MARERARRKTWLQRLERWRESGLRAEEFAAEIGVNANTLLSWKYKVAAESRRRGGPAASAAPVEFVEVVPPMIAVSLPSDERLEVVCLGGRVVRVPPTFNAEKLGRLLDVVERR